MHFAVYISYVKTYIYISYVKSQNTCTWMLRATVFITDKNLEIIKISFNRWVDKLTVVHLDNRILSSRRNRLVIKPWKDIEEFEVDITKWKKSKWKFYIPYDSNHMIFLKKQNHEDSKKTSCCHRFRGGGMSKESTEHIWGSENVLCNAMVNTCPDGWNRQH